MGHLDPDLMCSQMSARLRAEWDAFFLVEPQGTPCLDALTAQQVGTLVNINRGPKDKPVKIADCLTFPEPPEPKEEQTCEQQISLAERINGIPRRNGNRR